VSPEDRVLSIDVCPHLYDWAMFNDDFPFVDLVFNKIYFTLICLVHFKLLALPFVLSSIALMLSC
jgi:hypothetical protein